MTRHINVEMRFSSGNGPGLTQIYAVDDHEEYYSDEASDEENVNRITDGERNQPFQPEQFHSPCPTCNPENEFGHVCPEPIPTHPGLRILASVMPKNHYQCAFGCKRILPLRNLELEKCPCCRRPSCSVLYNESSRPYCLGSLLRKFEGDRRDIFQEFNGRSRI